MKNLFPILVVFISTVAWSQDDAAARRRNFNNDHDVALKEFDPVSYFKGKPTRGDAKINYIYKGLEYYFSSEANREEFKKAPEKYEPAYGGWCAYTVAINGTRVKVDPTTYKISEGKLYLFYNFNGDNRLVKWNRNEKVFKPKADAFWLKTMH
jgi:YHS domain-containing protein